jgi:hypothetical protein
VAPRGTYLGIPVSVGRAVELPRAPTDREWAILVSMLRDTFGARGRADSDGELREWRNGNLRASIAPTESGGYRLTLRTRKGNAVQTMTAGIIASLWGLVLLALYLFAGTGSLTSLLLVLLIGGVLLGSGVLGLPGWAAEREAQMESIAARAQALLGSEATEEV